MDAIHNFFNGVLGKVDKPEAGDRLPDEMTKLVLLQLSPLTWIATAPRVCRKWNRLVNSSMLWETVAKHYPIAFPFKSEERITLECKKQLYLHLNPLVETKKELFDRIEMICRFTKFGEITGINYTSDSIPEAYLKIFMVKFSIFHFDFFLGNFDDMEKKAICIYQIRGKKSADLGSKYSSSGNCGLSKDMKSVESKHRNITAPNTIVQEIFNQL